MIGASFEARPGDYVILNASDHVEQVFGSDVTDYGQALMWAVSQAITGRTRYTLAYVDQDGTIVHLIDVAHPQTR